MLLGAHALPAMAVWAVLGAALGTVSGAKPLLFAAVAYALGYGLAETLRLPLRVVTLSRQVPASWIRGRSPGAQVAVWGLALGPGLFTHNYYAGIWLIPMMLAFNGDAKQGAFVGALVGLGHGLARAVGILRLIPNLEEWERPATIILARFRWKLVDGLALVLAAGILMPRMF
jgi:hypothetical protein